MKNLDICILKDIYGAVLTKKQRNILESYYDFDNSLKEIADELSISRQSVHDAISNSTETLIDLEDKLGFRKKLRKIKQLLQKLKSEDNLKNSQILDELLREVEEY